MKHKLIFCETTKWLLIICYEQSLLSAMFEVISVFIQDVQIQKDLD